MSFIAWHVCDSANNSFAGTLSRMMYHTSETKALQETTLGERISHEKTPYEIFDIMEERPSTPPISSNLNPARINCATSTIIIANHPSWHATPPPYFMIALQQHPATT